MARPKVFVVLSAILLIGLSSAPASAADVLSVVPEDALGFVAVKNLADADAKLQKLAKVFGVPMPPLLTMAKMTTGLEKGLDEDGSGAVVFLAPEDTDLEPVGIMVAPVSDYKEFLSQLNAEDATEKISEIKLMNAPFVVANSGNYAVIAERKHRGRLEKLLESIGKPADSLSPLAPWIAENDAVGVMMPEGVKLFSYVVVKGMADVREEFAQFGDQMAPAVAVFEVYEKIFKFAAKEVSLFGVGVKADEQGTVHLASRTVFTAGGKAAKVVSGLKPAEGDLLAGLPGGPFVIAGGGIMPESAMEGLMEFSIEMMKAMPNVYGLSEEQMDKLAEASELPMKGVRGMSMVMGVGKAKDPVYSNIITVMKVDDSEQFLANYQKYAESMAELGQGAEKSFLKDFKVEKLQIAGSAALKLEMGIPTMAGMEDVPEMKEMMKKILGPDGKMTIFLAAADEHTVVSAYSTKRLLRQGLKAVKNSETGLSADPQVAKTAALLPAGAQWVGYWSPKGTADFVNRVIPQFAPSPEMTFRLPELVDTPPIGFAAKAAPGQLQTELVVPASVIKAVAELVVKLNQSEM